MLSGWWVTSAMDMGGPALVVAWAIWVIVSITLHELAHGWAALSRGDPTPELTGHMTWNPLVHMGLPSLVIFAIAGIAWGAMPIDPTRLRGRYAEAFVAFAGPLMNLALALLCILGGGIALAFLTSDQFKAFADAPLGQGANAPIVARIAMFCVIGSMLNVGLALFNLMPCPPLDGSRILANFWPWYRNALQQSVGQFASILVFALAFFFAAPMIMLVGSVVTMIGMGLLLTALKLIGVGP